MTTKYFIGADVLTGEQDRRLLGIKIGGKTSNTIELISLSIRSEDNKHLLLISKDFNLKEAWNRFELVEVQGVVVTYEKRYIVRERILRPLFYTILERMANLDENLKPESVYRKARLFLPHGEEGHTFNYITLKVLIDYIGLSREALKQKIIDFIKVKGYINPEFYIHDSVEKWIAISSLFTEEEKELYNIPKICITLKQEEKRIKGLEAIRRSMWLHPIKSIRNEMSYFPDLNYNNFTSESNYIRDMYYKIENTYTSMFRAIGKTTNQIDNAVQDLFEGKTLVLQVGSLGASPVGYDSNSIVGVFPHHKEINHFIEQLARRMAIEHNLHLINRTNRIISLKSFFKQD